MVFFFVNAKNVLHEKHVVYVNPTHLIVCRVLSFLGSGEASAESTYGPDAIAKFLEDAEHMSEVSVRTKLLLRKVGF